MLWVKHDNWDYIEIIQLSRHDYYVCQTNNNDIFSRVLISAMILAWASTQQNELNS